MPGIYSRWMDRWERRLATRDTNRKHRPFEWGLDWLSSIGLPGAPSEGNGDCAGWMDRFASAALADSHAFYGYRTPAAFSLDGSRLTFPSPVASPYPENDTVHADFYPAGTGRAVLVLPQWNAGPDGHAGLCRLLNRFGVTALRMNLAYHGPRMPKHLERADYHVSSNIGRTIHAMRQSVVDARSCLDWLQGRGYGRLAILGTSLGSCVAFVAAAHDLRVSTAVYNHVSTYFGDVVWTGLSTAHVRRGLEEAVTQDQLRRYWAVISPASFFHLVEGRNVRNLLIWARHDSTFLPVYSREVIRSFRSRSIPHRVFTLPCGHYTTGQFPFNLIDGLAMCRFLARNL
jgi:hypothetical protein